MNEERRPWLVHLTLILGQILALYHFSTGFLYTRPSIIEKDEEIQREVLNRDPPPPFDRLVFMLVDALRHDFVYSDHSQFHFVKG